MNDQLSEAFEKAMPEQPATTGWGAAARRRVARRRAAAAGVAGVAAVALAVPMALTLGGGETLVAEPSPSEATERPDANYPVESYEVPECREAGGTRVEVTDLPDGKLPEGAERIWLCGGGEAGSVVHDTELVGARDALTVGVDRAVEAFNALNYVSGAAIDCLGDGSTYHVVVEYPDGESHVVRGYNTPEGCNHFQLADGIVDGGGADYLALLQDLWAEQRESQPAPAGDVRLCPATTSVWSIDPVTLVRGWACTPAVGGSTGQQVELPPGLTERIVDGLSGTEPGLSVTMVNTSAPGIILVNGSGDPVTFRWQTWGERKALFGAGRLWRPDPATYEQIEALFESTDAGTGTPSATPSPSPEPSVPPVPTDLDRCPHPGDDINDTISLDDLVPRGYVCLETNDGVATRPLDDSLAADILTDLRINAEFSGLQPLFSSPERIVLWTEDGQPLGISWMGQGRLTAYPGGTLTFWNPPVELASRIYAAVTGEEGAVCVVPEPVAPSSVVVDVYNATDNQAWADHVAEGLREAGFTVRDATLKAAAELGGATNIRSSPENGYAAGWVERVLGEAAGGGIISRTDDVIDVVVTAEYDPSVEFVPVEEARPDAGLVCS